jgi:hypothetical protein
VLTSPQAGMRAALIWLDMGPRRIGARTCERWPPRKTKRIQTPNEPNLNLRIPMTAKGAAACGLPHRARLQAQGAAGRDPGVAQCGLRPAEEHRNINAGATRLRGRTNTNEKAIGTGGSGNSHDSRRGMRFDYRRRAGGNDQDGRLPGAGHIAGGLGGNHGEEVHLHNSKEPER